MGAREVLGLYAEVLGLPTDCSTDDVAQHLASASAEQINAIDEGLRRIGGLEGAAFKDSDPGLDDEPMVFDQAQTGRGTPYLQRLAERARAPGWTEEAPAPEHSDPTASATQVERAAPERAAPASDMFVCSAEASLRPVQRWGNHRYFAQMVDELDSGVVLVGEHGEALHINPAARRALLNESYPLQVFGYELRFRVRDDGALLRKAVSDAHERGLRRLVRLGDGAHRISIAVVPLPALRGERFGVALVLAKSRVRDAIAAELFARSHSLTQAETAVLKGLCGDESPQEIAQRLAVGLATVRTQIGSIRAKTGTRNIRELVNQVALMAPVMRPPGHASAQTMDDAPAYSKRESHETWPTHDTALTETERLILGKLSEGKNLRQTCRELGISPEELDVELQFVRAKLGEIATDPEGGPFLRATGTQAARN